MYWLVHAVWVHAGRVARSLTRRTRPQPRALAQPPLSPATRDWCAEDQAAAEVRADHLAFLVLVLTLLRPAAVVFGWQSYFESAEAAAGLVTPESVQRREAEVAHVSLGARRVAATERSAESPSGALATGWPLVPTSGSAASTPGRGNGAPASPGAYSDPRSPITTTSMDASELPAPSYDLSSAVTPSRRLPMPASGPSSHGSPMPLHGALASMAAVSGLGRAARTPGSSRRPAPPAASASKPPRTPATATRQGLRRTAGGTRPEGSPSHHGVHNMPDLAATAWAASPLGPSTPSQPFRGATGEQHGSVDAATAQSPFTASFLSPVLGGHHVNFASSRAGALHRSPLDFVADERMQFLSPVLESEGDTSTPTVRLSEQSSPLAHGCPRSAGGGGALEDRGQVAVRARSGSHCLLPTDSALTHPPGSALSLHAVMMRCRSFVTAT